MDISEVKAALGKRVRFRDDRIFCDGEYILTGCIIRLNEKGEFFYQAELQDVRQNKAVCITSLDKVTLERRSGHERNT